MPDKNGKPWLVRDVSERTRRIVSSYAEAHGLSVAQALEFLIDCAEESPDTRRTRWHDARIYFRFAGLPSPSESDAADLLSGAAEIRQQYERGALADTIDTMRLDIASLRFAGLIDSIPRGALGDEGPDPFARRTNETDESKSD